MIDAGILHSSFAMKAINLVEKCVDLLEVDTDQRLCWRSGEGTDWLVVIFYGRELVYRPGRTIRNRYRIGSGQDRTLYLRPTHISSLSLLSLSFSFVLGIFLIA